MGDHDSPITQASASLINETQTSRRRIPDLQINTGFANNRPSINSPIVKPPSPDTATTSISKMPKKKWWRWFACCSHSEQGIFLFI
jgi:hypothetical protein